jgi:hypothetical protein
MPKAGDTCRRCGHLIRRARFDTSTLADTIDLRQEHLVCDCFAGPLGPDEED